MLTLLLTLDGPEPGTVQTRLVTSHCVLTASLSVGVCGLLCDGDLPVEDAVSDRLLYHVRGEDGVRV